MEFTLVLCDKDQRLQILSPVSKTSVCAEQTEPSLEQVRNTGSEAPSPEMVL